MALRQLTKEEMAKWAQECFADAEAATFTIVEEVQDRYADLRGKVNEETYLKALCSYAASIAFVQFANSFARDRLSAGQEYFQGEIAELMGTMIALSKAHFDVAKKYSGEVTH